MTRRILTTAVLSLAMGAAAPRRAAAEPIQVFSNAGLGASYTAGYWDIAQRTIAFGFMPSEDVMLTSVQLSVARPTEGEHATGDPIVTLFASADGAPGTTLESFALEGDDLAQVLTTPFPLRSLISSAQPVLHADTLYWLGVRSHVGLTYWVSAVPLALGPAAFRADGSSDWFVAVRNQIGAFVVTGEPIAGATPEPGSMVLVATGVAGVFVRRRRAARFR